MSDGYELAPEPRRAAPKLKQRVLEQSKPCLRCGYDLKGLQLSGKCPECGGLVARSLQGDLLRFASPEYLRKLNTGAMLIVLGFAAYVAAIVLSMITGSTANAGVLIFSSMLILASTATLLVGWWMLTAPDPGRLSPDGSVGPRRLVRFALVMTFIATAMFFVLSFAPNAPKAAQTGPAVTGGLLLRLNMYVMFGAFFVLYFAGLVYVKELAKRIPDEGLQISAGKLMRWPLWFVVASIAALVVTLIVSIVPPLAFLMVIILLGIFVMSIIFLILYILIFIRLKNGLAIEMSRET